MHVFDPKTQTWELASSVGAGTEGKVYMCGQMECLAYMEGRWVRYPYNRYYSYCVVENVLYSYYSGEITWYDTRMAVLWDRYLDSSEDRNKVIWYAQIALKRHSNGEIWGNVEWCGTVLTVPESYEFEYVLAVTV
ncbi:F-box/kelch-repeat protein At4g39550 [Eutrema salsugineum]|uniref:F-box/kelch-repeat protein At4g39550 n=1 Tax=Eutrema salsugineum TaxID=72664 RepID=UPI000CED07A4|nr:F-box/kelch-repeat protein At4g39550 [Eutrema salsugineum]